MKNRNRRLNKKYMGNLFLSKKGRKKPTAEYLPKTNSAVGQLEELSREYRKIQRGHREMIYILMARAAALVVAIEADEEQLAEFWAHPYWVDQKGPKDLTNAVMNFVLRATTEASFKKAYKYARGMGYVVIKLNTAPEDVVEKVKELGGLQKVCDLAAEHDPRKTKAKKEVAADSDEDGSSIELHDDGPDDEASIPPSLRKKMEDKLNAKALTFRDDWEDEDEPRLPKVYSITAKLSHRWHQETEEMEIGERRVLTIRRVDGDPNFRVTRVKKLRTKKAVKRN